MNVPQSPTAKHWADIRSSAGDGEEVLKEPVGSGTPQNQLTGTHGAPRDQGACRGLT